MITWHQTPCYNPWNQVGDATCVMCTCWEEDSSGGEHEHPFHRLAMVHAQDAGACPQVMQFDWMVIGTYGGKINMTVINLTIFIMKVSYGEPNLHSFIALIQIRQVLQNNTILYSIANEINIHLCKHLFTIIVHNSFSICGSSTWWSRARMVCVTALDIQVSPRNPTVMLENSMTSVKMVYWWKYNTSLLLNLFFFLLL